MALVTVLGGARSHPKRFASAEEAMTKGLTKVYRKCTKKFSKSKCVKCVKNGVTLGCMLAPAKKLKPITRRFGVRFGKNRAKTCKQMAKKIVSKLKL